MSTVIDAAMKLIENIALLAKYRQPVFSESRVTALARRATNGWSLRLEIRSG
jgi:hypothetical protein